MQVLRSSLVLVPLALIALPSGCRTHEPPPAPAAARALDVVDVRPSAKAPYVYELVPIFDEIELVEALEHDAAHALERAQWEFDANAGRVVLRPDALARDASIRIHGRRRMPWAWHIREWDPDSVRVVLGEHAGERGRDFKIDEQRGILELTSAEWSDPARDLYVTYSLPRDPRHPEQQIGVAFGNHRDSDVVRRVLGLPAESSAASGAAAQIAQNAVPTQDPSVFRLARPTPAAGMRVGIAHSSAGVDEWLAPESYAYDEETGEVRLLARTVDPDKEIVIVLGARPSGRVLRLGAPLAAEDEVKIVVDGRLLDPESGFAVDRERGELTIFDPAFSKPGARYFVLAGSTALGNMALDDETRALLRPRP